MNPDDETWLQNFIETHHLTNRVSVSSAANAIVEDLADEFEGSVREASSGEEVLTWIIPEQWEVNEAWIATTDGEKILDFDDHPLHLKSYSHSFEGIVSKDRLEEKITTLPDKPRRIPYHYAWQFTHEPDPDWGFCAPHNFLTDLDESEYHVKVDTEFSDGTMKMFDWELPGQTDETIFFAAHTCHPGQVNDGLACVALLALLFKRLRRRENRRYNYRLLIGPEYFTAASLLDDPSVGEKLSGGVFLDRPGFEEPLGFSSSFDGETYFDHVMSQAFKSNLEEYERMGYRAIAGNDEMIYDGPDFEIPTIPVARTHSPLAHTDGDDLDHTDFEALDEVLDVLASFVSILERDYVATRTYEGNLYFSRYGLADAVDRLHTGTGSNPQLLHYVQRFLDGTNSCLEIAETLDVDFEKILHFVDELKDKGLVETHGSVSSERILGDE